MSDSVSKYYDMRSGFNCRVGDCYPRLTEADLINKQSLTKINNDAGTK